MRSVIAEQSIIVCCGPGGVGKTTTSAALALAAARLGRRAVVVTVDPARRLADTLGLTGGLDNSPRRVNLAGVVGGELWAMMLDPAATFDDVVRANASSPEHAERILANGFYRNISERLSGTQEYMAAEKLHQLHHDDRFDLVVVDTPPSRNALDVLDAPERLARFLDHRLYRTLVLPSRGPMRVVNAAAQLFLRSASKVFGGQALADAITFFKTFDGMEKGFRARSKEVLALFRAPETAYVVVTAPRRDRVEEVEWLIERLLDRGTHPAGLIVNRSHPVFLVPEPVGAGPAWDNLRNLAAVAAAETEVIAGLLSRVEVMPTVHVPLAAAEVDLEEVAARLVAD